MEYFFAHDDVIKCKHLRRYWPFERGIQRSPVNSPHKGQWRGALVSSFICAWRNVGINNRYAGDLRRHRAHYDVTIMSNFFRVCVWNSLHRTKPRDNGITTMTYYECYRNKHHMTSSTHFILYVCDKNNNKLPNEEMSKPSKLYTVSQRNAESFRKVPLS